MASSIITQPDLTNITIKEEPIEIHEVDYEYDINEMFEVKQEPEECFTIEEFLDIPEVKIESLDDDYCEIEKLIQGDAKRLKPARKYEPLQNPAKRQRFEVLPIKEEPEEKFVIYMPSNNVNNFLNEHNYFNKKHLRYETIELDSESDDQDVLATNEIQKDEDGIEYEEVNIFEVETPTALKPKTNHLKCPECPTILEDSLRLNRHMRLHKAPMFRCTTCLKLFKRKSSLQNHHCDFKCPICPGECTCRMGDSSKTCKICLKIDFRYFEDYKQHMIDYHNEVVVCEICEANNYTVFKHKQQGHSITKYFKCPECPQVMKYKKAIEAHIDKHSVVFECTECDEKFNRKFLLKDHLKLHQNPNPYHCSECKKSFQGKSGLELHKRVAHNKNSDVETVNEYFEIETHRFKCTSCPLLFKNRESRDRHFNISHGSVGNGLKKINLPIGNQTVLKTKFLFLKK